MSVLCTFDKMPFRKPAADETHACLGTCGKVMVGDGLASRM
jgi:hypothetical protein